MKTYLTEAIDALKLASECGGDNDREIYAAALKGLVDFHTRLIPQVEAIRSKVVWAEPDLKMLLSLVQGAPVSTKDVQSQRVEPGRGNEALFGETAYNAPASICAGTIFLESGKAIDLLKIQAACNYAFQETGEEEFMRAADDMSEITGMFQGPHGEWQPNDSALEQSSPIGKIWWNADNAKEAEEWKADFLSKGATNVELLPESDREVVSVVITLERARAKEILGVEPGPEEWLDEQGEVELAFDVTLKSVARVRVAPGKGMIALAKKSLEGVDAIELGRSVGNVRLTEASLLSASDTPFEVVEINDGESLVQIDRPRG